MYISKVQIRKYKSISELEIGVNPKINICVGKNGTGKTAFFDAIKKLIFKRVYPLEEFPDYISIELCDNQKKLGQNLCEFIKEQNRIPPEYTSFFENAFLYLQEPFRVEFIGEKINKNPRFYLKYKNIFFYDGHLFLDGECITKSHPAANIHEIQPEKVRDAKTLIDFVKNVITKETPEIYMGSDRSNENIVNKAFDFLQENTFFVGEMRDLRKENKKGAMSDLVSSANDSSYKHLQNSTIDPTTFIDKLYSLQNTKKPIEHNIVKCFEDRCKDDGYEVRAIEERPDKVLLRISEKGKSILLDNTSFPSGLLQKIFFNFVLAISRERLLLFEEPETNLHPGLQKHVFHLLKEQKTQVFITTHSPEFVDNTLINAVHKFQIDEQGVTQVKSFSEKENNKELFRKYFIVDKRIFFADFVILCEGHSEFVLIPSLFDELSNANGFFDKNNIAFINLDGCKSTNIYREILEIFDIPFYFILDKKSKGEDQKVGYNPDDKTYIYDFEDFDNCYEKSQLKKLKIPDCLEKKKLALEVLKHCSTRDEKVSDFFTDDAKKEFESMVNHFMKEYDTN